MNIYDPYYDETPTHERIKPQQLVKIPYCFMIHGLSALDEYIRLSPALDYLKTEGCLVVMVYDSHTLFYCDCAVHLETIKKEWSDGMAYFPLVLFEEHMTKLKNKKKVNKKSTKLKHMLDNLHKDEEAKVEEMHEDDVPVDNLPYHSMTQKPDAKLRAEQILRLIRQRQNKKK